MAKKKLTDKQKKERAARNAKKMTVGKALDMLSLGMPAINRVVVFAETGVQEALTDSLPSWYSGYAPVSKTFDAKNMVRGYGGAVNRAFEKKIFKALGIRGPRTQMKGIGDGLDWVTYFGATALHAWENKDSPRLATRAIHQTQFGVDLGQAGTAAYNPMPMITEKWLPYIGQKMIRKILRGAGVKMPKMMGG